MSFFHNTHPIRSFALAAAAMIGATSVTADELSRLGMAGELNTLVHKSAASVCMIAADVAVENEMAALAQSRYSFNVLLDLLETEGAVDEVNAIKAAWSDMGVAASMILAGDDAATYKEDVMTQCAQVAFATMAFMGETAAVISGASAAEVMTADLAERQQVLIQKMKLEACEMLDSEQASDAMANLVDTMDVFEATLVALTDGNPVIGVEVSEDYAINQVLAATAFDWQDMKPILSTIVENGVATVDDLTRLNRRAKTVDVRSAQLTDMYFTSVHGEIDILRVSLLDTSSN